MYEGDMHSTQLRGDEGRLMSRTFPALVRGGEFPGFSFRPAPLWTKVTQESLSAPAPTTTVQ